jgi:hypothetical protein
MRDARKRDITQIARRQHAGWQVGTNAAFNLGELSKSRGAASERLKSEIGLPNFCERTGDGACGPRKMADSFEFREAAFLECSANGGVEILRPRGPTKPPGEARSK